MVVLDVLAAYLSERVDSNKDQSVRRLLATLGAAAAKSGAAVLLVRHYNKAVGGPPMYRGGGSIEIIGAARAACAVVRDPDDADHRLLATVKSNLAPEAPTWGYCLVGVPHLGVAKVAWDAGPHSLGSSKGGAGAASCSATIRANSRSAWRRDPWKRAWRWRTRPSASLPR
jgi:hypothetical protein